jgi:hypothetical protein
MTIPIRTTLDLRHITDLSPVLTSITVLPFRLAMMTHFSSSKTTLQTASAGWLSSLTRVPFFRSQTFTRPSLPPDTILELSNCNEVTELSWAASLWIA